MAGSGRSSGAEGGGLFTPPMKRYEGSTTVKTDGPRAARYARPVCTRHRSQEATAARLPHRECGAPSRAHRPPLSTMRPASPHPSSAITTTHPDECLRSHHRPRLSHRRRGFHEGARGLRGAWPGSRAGASARSCRRAHAARPWPARSPFGRDRTEEAETSPRPSLSRSHRSSF
jgi:hypothetical protein